MCELKYKYCNSCDCAKINKIGSSSFSRYNLYCNFSKEDYRIVDLSVKHDGSVKIPVWCPKCKNKGVSLTFSEKMEKLRNMKPIIKWEDIKVDTVYHLPQLPGEERKNIIITYKSDYCLTYKEVSGYDNVSYTIYPSTIISKFLVENKIVRFVHKKK